MHSMPNLRAHRVTAGLSLTDVATALDTSAATVSRLERGLVPVSLERLTALAELYDARLVVTFAAA